MPTKTAPAPAPAPTKPLSRPMRDALRVVVDGIVYVRTDPSGAGNPRNAADVMAFRSDGRMLKRTTCRRKTIEALVSRGVVIMSNHPSGLYPGYTIAHPASRHTRAIVADHE